MNLSMSACAGGAAGEKEGGGGRGLRILDEGKREILQEGGREGVEKVKYFVCCR